ncbi:MAG: hypothetical protein ACJ8IK_03135, partial [Burkholderiaceae bacterium]
QGYDRDVPADMAAAGIKGFQEFFAKPDQMYAVMNRLDAVRGPAYAALAEQPASPAAPKGRKN